MAYELVTKDAVRALGNLTDLTAPTDTLLDQLISGVSSEIERICQRQFLARDYAVWINGNGSRVLQLEQFPLVSLSRLSTELVDGLRVSCSLTDTDEAFVSVDYPPSLVRLNVSSGAGAGDTDLSFAVYPTLADMATAINAVAGWSASVPPAYELYRCSLLHPSGAMMCLENNAYLQVPYAAETEFVLDYDYGEVELRYGVFPRGRRNIYVAYNAGYSTVPADLAQLAAELVIQIYYDAKRDRALQSETLGDYSWTAATTEAFSPMNETVQSRLAPYMSHPLGA